MSAVSKNKSEASAQPTVLPADCRLAGVSALRTVLLGAVKQRVSLLDGAGVERVDATALQLLVAFHREATANDHEIRWAGASDTLREAAELLGLTRLLDLPAARPA